MAITVLALRRSFTFSKTSIYEISRISTLSTKQMILENALQTDKQCLESFLETTQLSIRDDSRIT